MPPDKLDNIEAIFHSAMECSPEQRQAFLAEACSNDPLLRTDVERLIEAHEAAPEFLEEPLTGITSDTPTRTIEGLGDLVEESLVGKNIGPWKLIERIATGGMGTVYLAVRADGQYTQQAAIKLLRHFHGLDDPRQQKEMIRRFRDEQQHLAKLNHPNFARLLDAGTTDSGLPYLVMEYVQGLPITEFREKYSLSVREQLKLFRTVCLAIEHAHRNFIAHRDLKPGNILVMAGADPTSSPVPKLVDFGIAKLLSGGEFGKLAAITATGSHPMTPEYASPEQVCGEPVTALGDVYSLGVVLFELITRKMPYDVGEFDAKQIICEQAPRRPRAVDPTIDRDVEAIILKAIEKEPARRYGSAAKLADDIERYLTGRPIHAHPPSPLYQIEKFLWRQWRGIALISLFLIAGVLVGFWMSKASMDDMARQRQSEKWQTVMVESSTARELYQKGLYVEADALLRHALAVESGLPKEEDLATLWLTAETKRLRGDCLVQLKRYGEAELLLLESYGITHDRFGDDHSRTKLALASLIELYTAWNKADKAAQYRERVRPPVSTTLPSTQPAMAEEPASKSASANLSE